MEVGALGPRLLLTWAASTTRPTVHVVRVGAALHAAPPTAPGHVGSHHFLLVEALLQGGGECRVEVWDTTRHTTGRVKERDV